MSKPSSNTQITHALTSANNENKSFLKTWQLALAIGIPSAVIIGYFLYRRRQSTKSKSKNETKSKDEKTTVQSGVDSTKEEVKAKVEPPSKAPLDQSIDYKNDGNKLFQLKKFSEALDCYSKAIELCPKDNKDELPKFYQNRAASYENLKNYEKVIEDCDKALVLDPNYTKALLRRAKAYEQVEKYQLAFEDLTALCILENFQNEKNIMYADKLVKILGSIMSKETLSTRKYVPISKHFVTNFYSGLMNDPIYNNKQLLADIESNENKDEVKAILNAVNTFNDADYEKCIDYCTNEIDANGKYVNEALNLRGSLYMLRCQYAEAINDFNRILASENASKRLKSNSLIKMTATDLQRNDDYHAYIKYEKAIEIDETNDDIYCSRAQVHAMRARFPESLRDFDKTIELNPDNKIARLHKSFFQFRQFYISILTNENFANNNFSQDQQLSAKSKIKVDEEMRKLELSLENYSDVPEAFSLFAQLLLEQREFEEAEKYFKITLDKDPLNAAIIVHRAMNNMQLTNQFDAAILMLNQAIQVDDTSELAFESLAQIEIQRGNLDRSIELFEKAISICRNEDSLANACSMLIGAQSQRKILSRFSSQAFNIVANGGKN